MEFVNLLFRRGQPLLARSIAVFLLLFPGMPAHAERSARHTHAWEGIRMLQFNPSHGVFTELVDRDPDDREALFGQAIALLNVQPRTEGNVDEARRILHTLKAEDGTDFFGAGARFFLARIEQAHLDPPDTSSAVRRLRDLADDLPDAIWGQLAMLKAAPALLYEPGIDADERARRFEELQTRAQDIILDWVRRPFHVIMAQASLDFDRTPEEALDHLLAADPENLIRWQMRADAYVQIGEIARELGRTELARAYYRKFHDEFPRDYRHYMVGRLLEELEGGVP